MGDVFFARNAKIRVTVTKRCTILCVVPIRRSYPLRAANEWLASDMYVREYDIY